MPTWRYRRTPARRSRGAARGKRRIRLDTDERKAQLLALGRQAFAERTYDDVSIDDIAKSAGISKGLLYHYFPTKRDLYIAGLREIAKVHKGHFRLTPNQNVIVVGVSPEDKPQIEALLAKYGLGESQTSALRLEQQVAAEKSELEKRASELGHQEDQLEHRKRELDQYVAKVQGTLHSQP